MGDDSADHPEHPYVARRRQDQTDLVAGGFTLAGLPGDSDRSGFRRLYLSRDLGRYVEYAGDDELDSRTIHPDDAPFIGLEALAVKLTEGAQVEFIRSVAAVVPDVFDLDVRLEQPTAAEIPGRLWPATTQECMTVGLRRTCYHCNRDEMLMWPGNPES
jgi:hypothetical protein